jgi:hypothetical protein
MSKRSPSRRCVLRSGLGSFAAAVAPVSLAACTSESNSDTEQGTDLSEPVRNIPEPQALRSLIDQVGPLGEPNALGMRLPAGFSARIVARSGAPVMDAGSYIWHILPDGGATFATEDDGWIYVSNSEIPIAGGVGALRFDADGELIDAYPILTATNMNCAGGKTPWHTWLSCEEFGGGRVWECDPWGEAEGVERLALGRFRHEAATVDPVNAHVYLSEDETDGCLYRFIPDTLTELGDPDLTSGRLQVAVVGEDAVVDWRDLPDPQADGELETREQVAEATVFTGGEGIWWHDGVVYLSTKGDNRVWAYNTETGLLSTLYDRETSEEPILSGVDNLTVSCCGDVLVAEDGGSMQIVAILPDGSLQPLMQLVGQDGSEITGPDFDPSGTRLYFSSQRALGATQGITYEVTGPFHAPA